MLVRRIRRSLFSARLSDSFNFSFLVGLVSDLRGSKQYPSAISLWNYYYVFMKLTSTTESKHRLLICYYGYYGKLVKHGYNNRYVNEQKDFFNFVFYFIKVHKFCSLFVISIIHDHITYTADTDQKREVIFHASVPLIFLNPDLVVSNSF